MEHILWLLPEAVHVDRLAGLVLALAVLLKTDLLVHVEVVVSCAHLNKRPDEKRHVSR